MKIFCGLVFLLASLAVASTAQAPKLKGALLTPAQATPARLKSLGNDGFNAIVIYLEDSASEDDNEAAADRVKAAQLDLYYWIEIARNPTLAKAHPEWMASIQTHDEWCRHFSKFPKPEPGQVVKNYPWVPVLYEETFPVHLQRVEALLEDLPPAKAVFLNDLQGAPSACGCGNHFCRWTTDYGPVTTAKRLPNDAAAKFLAAVARLSTESKIIPVWTTECLEHDKAVACGGVNCYRGKCWPEYNAQLMPVAKQVESIGVLLPWQDFAGGESRSGTAGEWQAQALKSFTEILPQRGGEAIPPHRLISVVQGWDTNPEQQRAQLERSATAGVGGSVVAFARVDQSWEPRIFDPRRGR